MNYTEKEIDDLLSDIYAGRYDPSYSLPEDLYLAIAKHLQSGLYKGFGGAPKDFNFAEPDGRLLNELRQNVYMFSGAKTYQQVREMSDMVAGSENYSDFREKALAVFGKYNDDWLKAEYNTAIGQATQAGQWVDIEATKETFPLLKYRTAGDANVSDICRPLDGVIAKVDDPIWAKFSPLNHFNCRCILEKIDKYSDDKPTGSARVNEIRQEMDGIVQKEFKMNSGKDGYIFSPDHPYFEVAPKDRAFAKRNFDLPIPATPIVEPKVTGTSIEDRIAIIKQRAPQLMAEKRQAAIDYKTNVIDVARQKYETLRSEFFLNRDRDLYKGLKEKYDAALAEYEFVSKNKKLAFKKYNDDVVELLKSKNSPAEFMCTATKLQRKNFTNLNQGEDAFRKIIGDGIIPNNWEMNVKATPKRAFFTDWTKTVHITKVEGVETITHEFAHAIEYANSKYFDDIKAFYARRTAGESAESLRRLHPGMGYRADEMTKKDKFMETYTGKLYLKRDGTQDATEITSMWFSHVFTDLEKFIEKDPDHFEFIFKLFNR